MEPLETLLESIYGNIHVGGPDLGISPLLITPLMEGNIELPAQQRERKRRANVYRKALEAAPQIAHDGGITRRTYDRHGYVIHAVARDLTDQRWGMDNDSLLIDEDIDRNPATPLQIVRFPHDGFYPADGSCESYVNIFDYGGKRSFREGTVFDIRFGVDRFLNYFRIFHQGHPDRLKVTTVEIPKLVEVFTSNAEAYKPTPIVRQLPTKEEYLGAVGDFNEQYGKHVMLEADESGITARLPCNASEAAQVFSEKKYTIMNSNKTLGLPQVVFNSEHEYIELIEEDRNTGIHSGVFPGFAKELVLVYVRHCLDRKA